MWGDRRDNGLHRCGPRRLGSGCGHPRRARGIDGLVDHLTADESAVLNRAGVNTLRNLSGTGPVIWGTRTLAGADVATDTYSYVPVRRTALFLEQSLSRGREGVVVEPNDERLWARTRRDVGAFLQSLFRQGALQGRTTADAFAVTCDGETTTQDDIDRGLVTVVVAFAPLRPAEFVVLRLQQRTGRTPLSRVLLPHGGGGATAVHRRPDLRGTRRRGVKER